MEGEFCPDIVTICPTLILGEVIGAGDMTSASIVKKMLLGEIPGWPAINFNFVDIKDCTLAHLRALERPECKNKRYVLSNEKGYLYHELAEMLET